MERISSRQNPIVKRFRAIADTPGEYLLLDGEHLLEEALAAGIDVEVVAVADDGAGDGAAALGGRRNRAPPIGAAGRRVRGRAAAGAAACRHPGPGERRGDRPRR